MSSSESFRFSNNLRLSDKTAIQHVFQSGKKLGSRELSVFYYNAGLPHPRLCVSVSKKQIPKANARNALKRIVRESFRLNQHQLPACDMVVVVYKSMNSLDRKQMREKIDLAWKRLNTSLSN